MLSVSEINLYPVKSLAGISLSQAKLTVQGLKYDRHWMVTDTHYRFVTQRQLAEMALIKVDLDERFLTLTKQGIAALKIPLVAPVISASSVDTQIWRDTVAGFDEGEAASIWLTQALGLYRDKPLRLVRKNNELKRQVDVDYLPRYGAGFDADTDFSDGFPFLICSEQSLQQLNQHLIAKGKAAVEMSRFRANIVLTGFDYAWQEFDCFDLREANHFYQFSLRKPCQRCPIVTINQNTAEIVNKKEPNVSLAELNPLSGLKGAYFGQNAILTAGQGQMIHLGDTFGLNLKHQD